MDSVLILPTQPQNPFIPAPTIYVKEALTWQYKQVVRDLSKEQMLSEEELNKLGKDGWELAGTISQGTQAYFYFKRQVE